MDLIISNSSDKPIYEQITSQFKQMIMNGEIIFDISKHLQ